MISPFKMGTGILYSLSFNRRQYPNLHFYRKFINFHQSLCLRRLSSARSSEREAAVIPDNAGVVNMSETGSAADLNQTRFRRRLFALLEPDAGSGYRAFKPGRINPPFLVEFLLVAVIVLNSASLILWTVPRFAASFSTGFHLIEYATVAIFLVEYAVRLWTAPEANPGSGESEWRQRWQYVRSPNALVDAAALAPSAIAVLVLLTNGAGPSLSFLLTVRLLTRTAKLARYFPPARRLAMAIRLKASQLLTTVAGLLIALVIAAALMYFAETHAQPDVFPSIPAAMWWSVVTLTTVGYGDAVPITGPGRVLAAVIAVLGIGLFALPAGILSAGLLEAEATVRSPAPAPENPQSSANVCPHCGRPLSDDAGRG